MKEILKKISFILKVIFGYGIMICLFAGGFTFFGFLAALFTDETTAALICDVIYNSIIPVIVYVSSVLVLLGLVAMYLNGEVALTAKKKSQQKKQ